MYSVLFAGPAACSAADRSSTHFGRLLLLRRPARAGRADPVTEKRRDVRGEQRHGLDPGDLNATTSNATVKPIFTSHPRKNPTVARVSVAPSPCRSIAKAINVVAATPIPVPSSADAPARAPAHREARGRDDRPEQDLTSTTASAWRRPFCTSRLLKASSLPDNKKATTCRLPATGGVVIRYPGQRAPRRGPPERRGGIGTFLQCFKSGMPRAADADRG